jgi:hypothetical protein
MKMARLVIVTIGGCLAALAGRASSQEAAGAQTAKANRPATESASTIPAELLPSALVSYTYLARDPATAALMNAREGRNALPDLARLGSALDRLGCDLPTRLVFTDRMWIVDSRTSGQVYSGFPPGAPADARDALFVTTPLPGSEARVLAVVSSTGPDRLTVFTLDARLEPVLVYDSFDKHEVPEPRPGCDVSPLGAVERLRVLASGKVELREDRVPQARAPAAGRRRVAVLTPVGKTFSLQMTRSECSGGP